LRYKERERSREMWIEREVVEIYDKAERWREWRDREVERLTDGKRKRQSIRDKDKEAQEEKINRKTSDEQIEI
jgi:hypothetical protein